MVPLRSYPPYVLLVIEHLKAGMNGAAYAPTHPTFCLSQSESKQHDDR